MRWGDFLSTAFSFNVFIYHFLYLYIISFSNETLIGNLTLFKIEEGEGMVGHKVLPTSFSPVTSIDF